MPLCGLALVALGAMVFMLRRKLRLDGRTGVRLWLGGSAAGFVLWWIAFAALMSAGIDFSEESGAIGMAVVALAGAGLMALTVPPRRTSRNGMAFSSRPDAGPFVRMIGGLSRLASTANQPNERRTETMQAFDQKRSNASSNQTCMFMMSE